MNLKFLNKLIFAQFFQYNIGKIGKKVSVKSKNKK